MKYQSSIFAFFLTFLLSSITFAATQQIKTPSFTIDVPQNMKQTLSDLHDKEKIYQYVYELIPNGSASLQQIRITAVGKAPAAKNEYDEWETNALGANIAIFAQSYKLDLSKQQDALSKEPEILTLGTQKFKTATLTAENIQAYFLITVVNNVTYNITLVCVDKDAKTRKIEMNELLASVKSIKYINVTP